MALTIKICGLKTAGAVAAALEAGADMIGFVFFPKSPRHLDLKDAGFLADCVRGKAEIVALTVNADDALLADITENLRPDWHQLHGSETPERVSQIKASFAPRVMKVLGISTPGDVARVADFAGTAGRLLFDAKPPKDASRPGGLGSRFDWSLLNALDPEVPFMLSGGLDASNVTDAVLETRAMGVDVSSGVESAPGIKDPARIRAFIKAAREAAATKRELEGSTP